MAVTTERMPKPTIRLKSFDRIEIVTVVDNANDKGKQVVRLPPGFENLSHWTCPGISWQIAGVCEHPERRQIRHIIAFDAHSSLHNPQSGPSVNEVDQKGQSVAQDTLGNAINEDEDATHNYFVIFDKELPNDERIGICKVKNKGLIVLCPRSKSGIVKSIKYAMRATGERRVYAIFGGFLFEKFHCEMWRLQLMMHRLKYWRTELLVLGRCTGQYVINELRRQMPDVVWPSYAGASFAVGDTLNAVGVKEQLDEFDSGSSLTVTPTNMRHDSTASCSTCSLEDILKLPSVPLNPDIPWRPTLFNALPGRRNSSILSETPETRPVSPHTMDTPPVPTTRPLRPSTGYDLNADLRQKERNGITSEKLTELIKETNWGLANPDLRVWPLRIEYDRDPSKLTKDKASVRPDSRDQIPEAGPSSRCKNESAHGQLYEVHSNAEAEPSDHVTFDFESRRYSNGSDKTISEPAAVPGETPSLETREGKLPVEQVRSLMEQIAERALREVQEDRAKRVRWWQCRARILRQDDQLREQHQAKLNWAEKIRARDQLFEEEGQEARLYPQRKRIVLRIEEIWLAKQGRKRKAVEQQKLTEFWGKVGKIREDLDSYGTLLVEQLRAEEELRREHQSHPVHPLRQNPPHSLERQGDRPSYSGYQARKYSTYSAWRKASTKPVAGLHRVSGSRDLRGGAGTPAAEQSGLSSAEQTNSSAAERSDPASAERPAASSAEPRPPSRRGPPNPESLTNRLERAQVTPPISDPGITERRAPGELRRTAHEIVQRNWDISEGAQLWYWVRRSWGRVWNHMRHSCSKSKKD
ncbi:hypothetical protein K458DRAFT_387537 [Lentithecium fluviatile CBS 122367]|uniref:Uncharacterized protein n=1 Tax=Lentithecium fluviatile CBS 122367 TaxID=1168545 RepID=A0A6G1J4X7_9PLEO|nr:hypothetical protein K458DRAFT_387537 [Lentithecium fluviatile CBS 122367]